MPGADAPARGIDRVEWTFDPLEIKNAYFNLMRLGAVVRRLIPNCYGVTASPLHGGLLSGTGRKDSGERSSGGRAAEALARMRPQVEAYEKLCAGLGAEPALVALAWLLHQPAVTAPIIGPRTVAQLESALRALPITLDAGTLARLDEICPGPGGAAPEAYAC